MCGGTGIRVRLRFVCRKTWRFKSSHMHRIQNRNVVRCCYFVFCACEARQLLVLREAISKSNREELE